jgi:hypothetical protein
MADNLITRYEGSLRCKAREESPDNGWLQPSKTMEAADTGRVYESMNRHICSGLCGRTVAVGRACEEWCGKFFCLECLSTHPCYMCVGCNGPLPLEPDDDWEIRCSACERGLHAHCAYRQGSSKRLLCYKCIALIHE